MAPLRSLPPLSPAELDAALPLMRTAHGSKAVLIFERDQLRVEPRGNRHGRLVACDEIERARARSRISLRLSGGLWKLQRVCHIELRLQRGRVQVVLALSGSKLVLRVLRELLGARFAINAKLESTLAAAGHAQPAVTDEPVHAPWRSGPLGLALKLAGAVLYLAGLTFAAVVVTPLDIWYLPGPARYQLQDVAQIVYCALGTLLVYLGYRLSLRPAAQTRVGDRRAPIMFLRAFDDDGRNSFTPKGWRAQWLGLEIIGLLRLLGPVSNAHPLRIARLLGSRGTDSAEEQVARFLSARGPFVAFGRPGERLSPGGAAREYVEAGDWREHVSRVVAQAQMVVIQPGTGEGVWWELSHALSHVHPGRVLLSMVRFHDAADDYDEFRIRLACRFAIALPRVAPDGFIMFEGAWSQPRMLPLHLRSPFAWPLLGAVDFHATLAPFLTALDGRPRPNRAPRRHRFQAVPAIVAWGMVGMIVRQACIIALSYGLHAVGRYDLLDRRIAVEIMHLRGARPETRVETRFYSMWMDGRWNEVHDVPGVPPGGMFRFGPANYLVLQMSSGPAPHDSVFSADALLDWVERGGTGVQGSARRLGERRDVEDGGVSWREARLQRTLDGWDYLEIARTHAGTSGWVIAEVFTPRDAEDIFRPAIDHVLQAIMVQTNQM